MNKRVIRKGDAHKRLLEGINLLGDTVGSTLGPSGRTVIYQRTNEINGVPAITKDGVTVAMNVNSEDPVANVAIELVKDAARKTAIFAGDGTTTSTVLTQEIVNKAFESEIKSPRDFVKGMEDAAQAITSTIDENTTELNDELLKDVATISANNSDALGSKVAEAYREAGEYGFVGFEPNTTGFDTEVEVRNGTVLDSGAMDQNFYTDRENRLVEQDNPLIFVSYGKLNTIREIESIIEYSFKEKRPLTIIADCDIQVLQALAMNATKGKQFNVIKPFGVGIFLRENLEDIAAVTGAKLHGPHLGDDAKMINPEWLGSCKKLTTTVKDTLLEFDERGPKTEELAKQVAKLLEKEQDEGRINMLKKRMASLKGKFAMIKVGASSGVELNEKYDLVEDAVKAVSSAKQEGIVPGGGNMLRFAALHNNKDFGKKTWWFNKPEYTDYEKGYSAVIYAAQRPFERILENADIKQEGGENPSFNFGVDATSGKYVNLIEAGIVDPTHVVKQAIENSVSVAKTIITSSATIINGKED